MSTLNNQVAVVTGASSGIGKAIASRLAAEGASLCLVGRDLESLRAVADAADGNGSRHRCYRTDLRVDREVDELVAAVTRDMQSLDILVHSAGVISCAPIEAAAARQLDDHYRVNVRAPYVLTQGLLPALKSRRGQIVFVNSTAAVSAQANFGQYAASKHALKALADSLRDEVNPAGVRVLSLLLGRTATPMQAAVHAREGRSYHPELLMQPDDVAAVAIHALTLPRSLEITEVRMRPLLKTY